MKYAQWHFLKQLGNPQQKHTAEGVISEEVVGVEEASMSTKALCCNLLKHYTDIRLVLAPC